MQSKTLRGLLLGVVVVAVASAAVFWRFASVNSMAASSPAMAVGDVQAMNPSQQKPASGLSSNSPPAPERQARPVAENPSGTSVAAFIADLEARYSSDPDARAKLNRFGSVCSSLKTAGADAGSPRSARFDDPRWIPFRELCSSGAVQRWKQLLDEYGRLDPNPWSGMPPVPSTAEEFAKRDRHLERMMNEETNPDLAMAAAYLYFDLERFRQWAGPEFPHQLGSPNGFAQSEIARDIAWQFGCQIGVDCSPYSPDTLYQCVTTPGCVPGVAARQLIESRRSPLELQLIDLFARRLLEQRRGR